MPNNFTLLDALGPIVFAATCFSAWALGAYHFHRQEIANRAGPSTAQLLYLLAGIVVVAYFGFGFAKQSVVSYWGLFRAVIVGLAVAGSILALVRSAFLVRPTTRSAQLVTGMCLAVFAVVLIVLPLYTG